MQCSGLQCSSSAWPFITARPLASEGYGAGRWCDDRVDDFLPGVWTQRDSVGAYLAALHNLSVWKMVVGERAAYRKQESSRCHCGNPRRCATESVERWTFTPHTGCRRLSVHDGVARLRSRPLFIIGDSVAIQMWTALAAVHRASSTKSRAPWPTQVRWYCLPDTAEEFVALLRRAGIWRETATRRASDEPTVIVSFGAWYNVELRQVCGVSGDWNTTTYADLQRCGAVHAARSLAASASLDCGPPVDKQGALQAAASQVAGERRAAHRACVPERASAHTAGPLDASTDPCYAARATLCRSMRERDATSLDQCAYARHNAGLAATMATHRQHLPAHVFFLDSPPVHTAPMFESDHGRWRTRARAIWQRLAPWVRVLPAFEMLVPQGKAKLDEVHWCIDTTQYAEYLSSVLTAVVGGVGL